MAAFFAQTLNKTFVIADYYVNTGAYEKNCENKARPMMHCNGKCQMMKKLKEQEKKDEENNERKANNKTEITSFQQNTFLNFPAPVFIKLVYSSLQQYISGDFVSYCFHPPQC